MTFLIVSLFFLGLYLAFKHITPLGNIIRFAAEIAGKLLHPLKEALLLFQASQPASSVKYIGLRTIIVFVFFALSMIALSADIFGSLQALTALLGGDIGLPLLPSWFTYSMAALLTSTSAICGGIWLEGLHVLPEEVQLFVARDQDTAKTFHRLIGAGFWLSITANFLYFTLRPFFQANPSSTTTHALQVLVFLLLGLLLPIVGSLCLFLVSLGLQSILVLLGRMGLVGISMLSDVCAYLASHFGTQAVAQVQSTGKAPAPIPPLPAPVSARLPQFQVPQLQESEVIPMSSAYVSLIFTQSFGSRIASCLQNAIDRQQAGFLFHAFAVLDRNRVFTGDIGTAKNIGIPCSGATVPDRVINNLVEELTRRADTQLILSFLDWRMGKTGLSFLRKIATLLPQSVQAVILSVSKQEQMLPNVQEFLQEVVHLKQDGIIVEYLILDPESDFATTYGEPVMWECTAEFFVTFCRAHLEHPLNRSAIEVLQEMGRFSCGLGLAFAIENTILGKTPGRAWWQKFFTRKAVMGNVGDMKRRALNITELVMHEPTTRAFSEAVPLASRLHCQFTVPLEASDARFDEFSKDTDRDVRKRYPTIRTNTVSGNAHAYTEQEPWSPRLGVTLLSPLENRVLAVSETTPVAKTASSVPPASSLTVSSLAVTEQPALVAKQQQNGKGRPKTVRKTK